jgi:hypothetical protein
MVVVPRHSLWRHRVAGVLGLVLLAQPLVAQTTIAPDIDRLIALSQERPNAFPAFGYRILRHMEPFLLEQNKVSIGSIVLPQEVGGPRQFPMKKDLPYFVATPDGELREFMHPGGNLGAEHLTSHHVPFWYLHYGQRNAKWDKAVLTALYAQSYHPLKALQQWELAERAGYQPDILSHWSGACVYAVLGDRVKFQRAVKAIGQIARPVKAGDFPHVPREWWQMAQMAGDMTCYQQLLSSFPDEAFPLTEAMAKLLVEEEEKHPFPDVAPSRAAQSMKRTPFLKRAVRTYIGHQGLVRQARSVEGGVIDRFAPMMLQAPADQFATIRLMAPGEASQMDVSLEFQFTEKALNEKQESKFSRLVELSLYYSKEVPAQPGAKPGDNHRYGPTATIAVNGKLQRYGEVCQAKSAYHRKSRFYPTRRKIMPEFGPYQFHPFPYLRCHSDHFYQLRVVKVGAWVECLVDGKRVGIFPAYQGGPFLGFYMRVIGTQINVRSMTGHVLE